MNITRQEIQEMIRDAFTGVNESDLITKNRKSWEKIKKDFKEKNDELLNHIDDDNYKNADEIIDKVISILEDWKEKISKNL